MQHINKVVGGPALVMLVMFMLVMPVAAQDINPEVTDVVAGYDVDLIYAVIMILGGLCLGLIALFGGALVALYKSQPQWGQLITKEILNTTISSLQRLAEQTPSQLDDSLLKEISDVVNDRLYGGGVMPARASPADDHTDMTE